MSNIENNNLQLLEHQDEAYNEVIKLFEEKGKAAVIFPTGCGKSFVTLKYILEHPDDRILFLSPRNAIKDQMYEYIVRYIGGDFRTIEEIQKEYGMENNASSALRMAAKEYIPNIECMLYQTISGYGEKDSVNGILEQLKPDVIIVDEMHHLKTKSIKEAGRSNIILEDESDEIVEDDEDIDYTPDLQEHEQQNKWGEKFYKFLADNPKAKLLGLSATPLRTDGANVVERIFEDSVASDISLLEAIEQGIIYPPKYVVPDFIREDELETLLQKIEQAEGLDKEQLKEKYDDLVKKSANAPGIPDLMQEHIEEKDGKYIVYCKDVKDMQEKMEKAKEWFGEIDKKPEVYGIHSKDKSSAKQLEKFKSSNSEHLKLMYCVGMIDEGMHLSDISGVILSSKTGSRPTYLQRIGRGISSGKDKKQALVIDLVNNNEILYESKVQHGYEVNDLELLQELVKWVANNDGELPKFDEDRTTKERTMAKRLARINNKYLKYADDEKLIETLENYKQKQIRDIIELGSAIGMFECNIELDFDDKGKKINVFIDEFLEEVEIKGIRRDFREILSQQTNMSPILKNALEIENWCKKNFGDKEIWDRNLPKTNSQDEDEKRLGRALATLRVSVLRKYQDKEIEEIENKEHRRIVEIIRELDKQYGLSDSMKNVLEIENWCKTTFKDKEIWERRLPSKSSEADEKEKKLANALNSIRTNFLNKYEGEGIDEIEDKEHRRIVEIIRELDEEYGLSNSMKNALEIENWCKTTFKDREIWERRLPSQTAKDENEKRLGLALRTLKKQRLKEYKNVQVVEVCSNEDEKILKIVRRLEQEYGLSDSMKNVLEIENWCKKNFGDKQPWERRIPRCKCDDKLEQRLGTSFIRIKSQINKQYEGKELEEIENEEHRRIVEIIRELDEEYGLSKSMKNVLEIENWCKKNFGDKQPWERRLPRFSGTDCSEAESKLGNQLRGIRFYVMKKYEGMELKQIKDDEDRRIVEIIRELDEEYGLSDSIKNVLEIENWCRENYGDKPLGKRKLPSNGNDADEKEKRLARALVNLRIKLKKYNRKELEEIENEEDRRIAEIVRKLDEEYNPKNDKQKELVRAKKEYDSAKQKNKKTIELEQQVEKQLNERGKNHEEQ